MSRTPNIRVRKADAEDACQDLLPVLDLARNSQNKTARSDESRIISPDSHLVQSIGKVRGDVQSKPWSLQLWIFKPDLKLDLDQN